MPSSSVERIPERFQVEANGEKPALFSLDEAELGKRLNGISPGVLSSETIYFPDAKGRFIQFRVKETPVFAPELAAKYPNIRSFTGYSTGADPVKIRFSYSHNGLQSMMISPDKGIPTFIEKLNKGANVYAIYNRDGLSSREAEFVCNTQTARMPEMPQTFPLFDDQVLRRYRIAVSATGEYTVFHGGTVADALAAINATLTRVNEVFETDLAVTFELVADNDLIIFTDPDTDPYGGNLNTETQNTISSTIGALNYDVGHLFHEENIGGNAGFIGAVCQDERKASAYSASLNPEGDRYDIDLVAHELGHQFGANHTFSHTPEGTGVQFEPGSGTTIMSYAGITGEDDVAGFSDPYFHYISIFQIANYLQGNSCAVELPLANNPPLIQPLTDYSIPRGTAFVLTGNASDPDTGDVLTYTWEQADNGLVTASTFGPENVSGANFRSLEPTSSPERYFPKLSRVASGNLTQTNPVENSAWETVSTVEREMNFALTVRDNAAGGGQLTSALMKVDVVNNAGPFVVTSQSNTTTYSAGSAQTVSWEVSGTDEAPIFAQYVDIFLSLDGGNSFPIILAEQVPNDGEQEVLLPGSASSTGRIMVKASNNIFFAVNAADFTITESEVVMDFEALDYEVCQPNDLTIPFEFETYQGFSETVTFSIPDAPAGLGVSFNPSSVDAETSVNLTISNTATVAAGEYPLTVTATSASQVTTVTLQLKVYNNSFADVSLLSPANGASDVSLLPVLQWEANANASSYQVEIATDAAFGNVVDSGSVLQNQFEPQGLQESTTYYWRVKPVNPCGEGTFSTAFNFTTIQLDCETRDATDTPRAISSAGTPTVTSEIMFLNDLTIADVDVQVNIEHTYVSDLVIRLISPSGTAVTLVANACGSRENINAIFDDDAQPLSCGVDPAISGTVKPVGSLSSFNGESTLGTWTLEVSDVFTADGGFINGFSLSICAEGQYRPDNDNDGVFDDTDDLCLGTPEGLEVNADGCPVYRFDENNFTLSISSESCRGNNDGSIQINPALTRDYTVSITGPGTDLNDSFTNGYSLSNLGAGVYQICINGTEGSITYETLCFEAVISEPEPIDINGILSADGTEVTLSLNGADFFNIELNGVLTRTSDPLVTLKLDNGPNTLRVTGDLPCQGLFEESYFLGDRTLLYPNPVKDQFSIFLVEPQDGLQVIVFDIQGRMFKQFSYSGLMNQVDLDASAWPSGMYFISLKGESLNETHKMIRR
ncbi:zinc-dependent metalloprotease [Lentiprolixibacter aurantiacus]|uniref:M12 family metallo-peptidase n=1 Tax=Lentiprolixibacter aurantiacus TaxID=2993939 RepID=A0AAE3MJZ8_9FLAO|nr:zinc-dependent metalloprotease family protein [Lentiprolixibacter aurantiacus]MCX2718863.1 M12 family metallo-peptidase [Lentiprolixibacter aurantiacus]